jgi:ribonuclease HIII
MGARWNLEWGTVESEGESIGLAIYVAAGVATNVLEPDSALACTGRLDVGGPVLPVGGIRAKLIAAARAGVARVLLPEGNRQVALEALQEIDIPPRLIFVRHKNDIREALSAVGDDRAPTYSALIRFARSHLRLEPVSVSDDPREQVHRLWAEDLAGKSFLDIYPTGTVVIPPGPPGTALEAVRRAKLRIDGPQPEPRERVTLNIPANLRAPLRDALVAAGAAELATTSQYEAWRVRYSRGKSQVLLIQYTSGKLDIPPSSSPAFEDAIAIVRSTCPGLGGLEAVATGAATPASRDTTSAVDESKPYIGTDEAGKGDYFGPLVCAAVFVDPKLGVELRGIGVKDSKLLSDTAVRKMASEVRRLAYGRYKVTLISPRSYNQLYEEMRAEGKNLNTLLAWGHTRSIEDLIRRNLLPAFVVSDQFGDPRYIEEKLLADTRQSGVGILQEPKAERYVAVAAASILARDSFLEWMDRASARLQRTVPKGASASVIDLARDLYRRGGDNALLENVKVSFRTTAQVRSE